MPGTATETKVKAPATARTGTGLTIASVVALAVPLLYLLYGYVNGNVQLSTADQIDRFFKLGIILTAVAGVVALIATAIHGTSMRRGFTTSKTTQAGVSVLVLIVAAAFLLTTVLPRANAIQNLNDKIAPFGFSLVDNCQTPLGKAQADIKEALLDAQVHGADDAGFVAQMQIDIGLLQTDSTALTNGLAKLNATTAPDSKYQPLLDGCKKDVRNEIALLNDSSALPLPPQVVALVHISSLSTLTLLQDAAGVASGQVKIAAPDGSAQLLVQGVLTQVVTQNSDPTLTREGDQLKQDINNILKDNLAPFQPGPSLLVS
ncbi:MAG: hypothetical protein IVW57_13215 [Ktedonobacterales bacterium]|nr:hypothetical protein [Ktedonobacterales bacterium]